MAVQQHPAERWGEWLASRRVGQLFFRVLDSTLRLVEKSLIWSTQSKRPAVHIAGSETETKNGDGESRDSSFYIVSRPLSWPLFLPLLGMLGAVRISVYYISRILRRPIDTTDMIRWLQNKRYKLRAIKFAGLKNMRQEEDAGAKPGRTPNGTPCAKRDLDSTTPDHERKRKYCDLEQSDMTDSSDDESVAVMLEKYGDEDYNSESDPDYVPSNHDDTSEDEDTSDEDEEDEGGAVLLNTSAAAEVRGSSNQSTTPVPSVPASNASIVNVESPEPVSDYGSAAADSPVSSGSSLASSPLNPKSKFVKFFRRGSKTKQQV